MREFETLLRPDAARQRARRPDPGGDAPRRTSPTATGACRARWRRFLGDRGALQGYVNELFDPAKRDSAIGRMQELLGRYFDGDASRLATLLDPTRMNSPLHQFRTEIAEGFARLNERLTAMEAAAAARGAERAKSAAKGADFEDLAGGRARAHRPRRRRPHRPDRHGDRHRRALQEGRLRHHPRRRP